MGARSGLLKEMLAKLFYSIFSYFRAGLRYITVSVRLSLLFCTCPPIHDIFQITLHLFLLEATTFDWRIAATWFEVMHWKKEVDWFPFTSRGVNKRRVKKQCASYILTFRIYIEQRID